MFLIIRELLKEFEIIVGTEEIFAEGSDYDGAFYYRIKNLKIPEFSSLYCEYGIIHDKQVIRDELITQKRKFKNDVSAIDSCVKSILNERDGVISKNDIYEKIRKMRSIYEEPKFDWNFGFIKVYVDNKNNIDDMLKMFFDKYKEVSESHDKIIEECYDDCDIEYLPEHVRESDIQIDNEGFLMDVGKLSLLAYGDRGVQVPEVDGYLDDIVNSLKYVIEKYAGVKYEGAVSLEDSTDGPGIQLVGCVRDYSYTLKRLANQAKTDEIAQIYI